VAARCYPVAPTLANKPARGLTATPQLTPGERGGNNPAQIIRRQGRFGPNPRPSIVPSSANLETAARRRPDGDCSAGRAR